MDRLVQTPVASQPQGMCDPRRDMQIGNSPTHRPGMMRRTEAPIVQSEGVLQWLWAIRNTVTGKVNPLILAKLFCDRRNAAFLFLDVGERGKTIDTLTHVG